MKTHLLLLLALAGFGHAGYAATLYGFWSFSEGSGTMTFDNSGMGDNGTLSVTGATWAVGGGLDGGNAIDLSNGGYVTMGNPALLALGDSAGDLASWTLQAWINTTQTSATLVAGEQISGVNQGYGIATGNFDPGCTDSTYNGKAAGYTASGGGGCFGTAITTPSTTTINDSTWHQVVVVDNNGTPSIYVDASLQGTASPVGTLACSAADFVVGGGTNNTSCSGPAGTPNGSFTGLITDVGVWNGALTSGQIQAAFNDPNNPFAATQAPEPVSFALAVLGLAALWVVARRRHRRPMRFSRSSMRASCW